MTAKREEVEMVDGRVYFSDDNWVTVYKARFGGLGGGRPVKGREADLARFLAIHAHPAYADGQQPKRKKR